jgi:hypothetical protein
MVFTEWVKKSHFSYGYGDHDDDDASSQAAIIHMHERDHHDHHHPTNLEKSRTKETSSCSSPGGTIDEGHQGGMEDGKQQQQLRGGGPFGGRGIETDSSSDDPDYNEKEYERIQRQKNRKFLTLLWIGICCIVMLAIGIGVGVALVTAKGSSDGTTTTTDQQQNGGGDGGATTADEDFDFTDVSIHPSQAPSSQPAATDPVVETSTTAPVQQARTEQPISPTISPSKIVLFPSAVPSIALTTEPTVTATISIQPSLIPSAIPSGTPSTTPTDIPTAPVAPVTIPPVVPFDANSTTLMTFCVIADVPYTREEAEELPNQLATQMEGCEFLVHLGDIFIGDTNCDEEEYLTIRDIMLKSAIPTFVVLGDNEWNDCVRDQIEVGFGLWTTHFQEFHNNWNHSFTVIRQPGYEENFAFIHKRTLIIALNIVGGRVHNDTEWSTRLEDEFVWAKAVMDVNLLDMGTADGVILMGHAKPSSDHRHFFDPFLDYVQNELANGFPILYLHGDGHSWMYTPNYENQSNLLRIQHEGGVNEPILKVYSDPSLLGPSAYNSFQFDRQITTFGAEPKPESDKGNT